MAKKTPPKGQHEATGAGLLIGVRCRGDFLDKIDKWRASNPGNLSRPAAIRWLAELALNGRYHGQPEPSRNSPAIST